MLASKVTVSDETLKKNRLTSRQRGQLRFKRLQELDKSGELSKATTRGQVAILVGYGPKEKMGVSWVNNMIHRGYLAENLINVDGKTIQREFHTTSKTPSYGTRKRRKQIKPTTIEPVQAPVVNSTSVKIEYKEMVVTIEGASAEYVGNIIKVIQ